ncbi:ABC1 kinase family protein [Sphingomonas sp. MMS24-J45]|uniref:ABC1 kinase family protein n=1 Tax=Sphingomonas sp. MMS24-J45 TaxID=3238806 RepID=UPI00384ED113
MRRPAHAGKRGRWAKPVRRPGFAGSLSKRPTPKAKAISSVLKTLIVASRDRRRLSEIVGIASRFGLGASLLRLGLTPEGAIDQQTGEATTLAKRTRLALEELGPTFVKLGQILATRSDLLPPDWIAELELLHSRAPTLPFELLRAEVEAALGEPPETAFAAFDPEPLAAASIAQVHRATLHDATAVVLKIRRPGIRPQMEADLRLIAHLAHLAEANSAELRRFRPVEMVRQLAEAVLEELDFTGEGRNADRFRVDFADEPRIVVPTIHWARTSETLLVMDYIAGVPPRDRAALEAAGIDPRAIAALGADVVLDMVLINGRFHGDPHPGNLLCLPGDRIALLDLGLIGHVSPRRREEVIGFVQSVATADATQLGEVLATWSAGSGVSRDVVQAAADRLIVRHGGGTVQLSALVADMMPLLRDQGMTMPPDLLLMFKALVTIDGVLQGIEPDFDLTAALQRASSRILAARLSPDHWGPLLQALAWEVAKIGDDAPRLVRAAIRRLDTAEAAPLPVDLRAVIAAGSRWVAAAILLGAGIVAAAVLLR